MAPAGGFFARMGVFAPGVDMPHCLIPDPQDGSDGQGGEEVATLADPGPLV